MSFLLVSDLDGTILGDDAARGQFIRWWQRYESMLDVIYASGRFCSSMRDDIERYGLPTPLALIGGVGSEIWFEKTQSISAEWTSEVSHRWKASEVLERLEGIEGLVLQPEEFQSPLKISYYLHDANEAQIEEIRHQLETPWLRCELIYSSRRDLDVLPQGVSKGAAASFILNVRRDRFEGVVVAGDSGNDLSLFYLGYPSIIVANAQKELSELKGPHVYHASRAFASGVIEGIEHWFEIGNHGHSPNLAIHVDDSEKQAISGKIVLKSGSG